MEPVRMDSPTKDTKQQRHTDGYCHITFVSAFGMQFVESRRQ